MNLETEQLKLKLIETQMIVLQYQHKEVSDNIQALLKAENEPLPTAG
jgi:hypothetical protein